VRKLLYNLWLAECRPIIVNIFNLHCSTLFPQSYNKGVILWKLKQWMISKNIHTYIVGSWLEFWGQGGFCELEIQRHGCYLWLEFQGHGGISREDWQECESANELTTLLTVVESKIQDKHLLIMHVFMFTYRRKRAAHWAPEALSWWISYQIIVCDADPPCLLILLVILTVLWNCTCLKAGVCRENFQNHNWQKSWIALIFIWLPILIITSVTSMIN